MRQVQKKTLTKMVCVKQYKSVGVCMYASGFLLEFFICQLILSFFSGLPKLLIVQAILRILSTDRGGKSHGWQSFISFNNNFCISRNWRGFRYLLLFRVPGRHNCVGAPLITWKMCIKKKSGTCPTKVVRISLLQQNRESL